MKKILISLAVVVAVAAVVIGGTIAYFSDTETSSNNTFTAGTIDLKISNGSGWTDSDIKLVELDDLKPGVIHYVKKYLKVESNPANVWLKIGGFVCETGIVTDAECEDQGGNWDGAACTSWGTNGDYNKLHKYTTYDLFIDKNKNGVFDAEDEMIIDHDDHMKLSDIANIWIRLGEFEPGTQVDIVQSFELQKEVTNWAQGDKCTFTEEFLAMQVNAMGPDKTTLLLENKDGAWNRITGDGMYGILTYTTSGPNFDYDFVAHGLQPNKWYSLVYYADGWPGNNPGAFIGSKVADGSGNIAFSGTPDLGMDLPMTPDTNAPAGAKIWLVTSNDYNNGSASTGAMNGWNPADYLFEYNLIQYDDTDI